MSEGITILSWSKNKAVYLQLPKREVAIGWAGAVKKFGNPRIRAVAVM